MWSARYFTARHWDARFWSATGAEAVAVIIAFTISVADHRPIADAADTRPQFGTADARPVAAVYDEEYP